MLYRFEHFTLDTSRRELRDDGELVALEPQVFDLLVFLVEARDRVVTRDDLLDVVWQGRIVSEATLSSRLNAARTAVGDSGAAQRLIRTLPRRGVRFVGSVQEHATAPPEVAAHSSEVTAAGGKDPAIAVLAFDNMSGDPAQDYFAQGMAEEIITALSRCGGLLVIARNSSFAYKGKPVDVRQIGRDLGVGYVLEGSVRRDGDRLRITGQLVDARTGAHLWAERFEGGIGEVFALQDRVAESVVAAIEPAVRLAEIRRAPPDRLDAYDLLLRAQALEAEFTAESLNAASACLAQALTLDPDYAPALAAFAYCQAQRHFQGWGPPDENSRLEAVRLACRALDLAPDDPRVLWMGAFAIWNMAGEGRERARPLFSRSLMINPNSAMALTLAGWIEIMCGNLGPGRDMIARARRLNPRDPHGWLMSGAMALAAMIEADHASAASWAEDALAQNPRFAVALRVLAVALVMLGRQDRARSVVDELLRIEPELTVSGFLGRIPVPLETMARTYAEALSLAGLPA